MWTQMEAQIPLLQVKITLVHNGDEKNNLFEGGASGNLLTSIHITEDKSPSPNDTRHQTVDNASKVVVWGALPNQPVKVGKDWSTKGK